MAQDQNGMFGTLTGSISLTNAELCIGPEIRRGFDVKSC